MTRHSRANAGVARSRMITTEECLRTMFGGQGEGWNMANSAGARGSGGAYDVSGMFANEWETQLDDNGLPVFVDQAGYRPAGVNGPGGQADWFGALFSQGDDGEADEGGNAVSGSDQPAAKARAAGTGGTGKRDSGSGVMPQAGPDQNHDLTPDMVPREEVRRFTVSAPGAASGTARGGTSSVARPPNVRCLPNSSCSGMRKGESSVNLCAPHWGRTCAPTPTMQTGVWSQAVWLLAVTGMRARQVGGWCLVLPGLLWLIASGTGSLQVQLNS